MNVFDYGVDLSGVCDKCNKKIIMGICACEKTNRKLASIQKILAVEPIEGADNIEKVKVLGWQVVVKKGEFKPGDLCVFFEIDSFLPIREEFEFLRKSSYRLLEDGKEGFRLKSCKLRKTLSQGLVMPLSILDGKLTFSAPSGLELGKMMEMAIDKVLSAEEGLDVTEILGITKYEIAIPVQLKGILEGKFPTEIIPKTDEIRIQSEPGLIEEMKGKEYYITVKVDGTSATFYKHNDKFGVCGRNWEHKLESQNAYMQIAQKYDLQNKLNALGKNLAIQGEIAGLGIQKNPLGLKELELFVFSIYDIDNRKYLDLEEFLNTARELNLRTVPFEGRDLDFDYIMEELIEKAKGKYVGTQKNREGIVIRPIKETYSELLKGRLSFKVVNDDYLLKDEE